MASETKAPFRIDIDAKTQKILRNLKNHAGHVSLINAFRAIGISYRKEVKGIFERKQVRDPKLRWKPLSPNYEEWKKKHYPGQGLLVLTGELKKSMTQEGAQGNISKYGHDNAFFGTDVPYGVYHDNLDEPRKKIPLRNFSQPSVSTYGSWINMIEADLKGQLKALGVEAE